MKLKPLSAGSVSIICTAVLPPLRGYRFFRVGVSGDGSCFFHSLCASLNYMGYLSGSLDERGRARVTFEMRRKLAADLAPHVWQEFTRSLGAELRGRLVEGPGRTYEAVVANLSDPSFWADELIIRYVSWIMHLNIVFLDDVGSTLYCGVHNMEAARASSTLPTMVVAWVGRSHFEPIGVTSDDESTCVAEDGRTCVQGKFIFVPGEDDEVVSHIIDAYLTHCST